MASMIVPPGGFTAFNAMTPASRAALSTRTGVSRPARRRKPRKAAKAVRRASGRRGTRKSGRKMKFGSPAWQKKYKVGRFAKK